MKNKITSGGICKIMAKTFFLGLWMTLACITRVSAEGAPWSYVTTGVSHTIFLAAANTPLVEGIPIDSGDYIGVFYKDPDGTLKNGGYTLWNGSNTYITAYGDDGVNPGFKTGDTLVFKIWKSATSCEINNMEAQYLSGGVYISSNTFQSDGISGLASLTGSTSDITYPLSDTCVSELLVKPTTAMPSGQVKYRCQNPGLALDSLSGEIDLSESLPGSYVIEFETDLCLKSYTADFLVSPALSIINIPQKIVNCGPYEIDLNDSVDTFLWSTGEISESIIIDSSGDYWVEITRKNGCKTTKTFKATISNFGISSSPVQKIIYKACSDHAKVILDTAKIEGGIPPYALEVSNNLGTVFEDSTFGTFMLPDKNSYDLRVTDSIGCVLDLENAFTVNNPEECPYNVISPNRDGLAEGIYLKENGLAKIYDRSGNLKIELTIPAEWDGKDRSGNILPTGIYYIIINDRKKEFVTIVR